VRAALVLVVLAGSSCSLIISSEIAAARNKADAGTGGGSATGGGTATGGGSATGGGGEVGGGSGAGGGSGVYDGGLPCASSPYPHLACTLLLTFDAGSATSQFGGNSGALAATDDTFIAAFTQPGSARGVEVTRQPIAGGASTSTILTSPSAGDAPMVAASAAGSHWAVAWIYPVGAMDGDLEVSCLSDLDNNTPRRYPLGAMTSGVPWVAVASRADGSVGLAATTFDSGFNFGTWFQSSAPNGGCPAMLGSRSEFTGIETRQSFVINVPQAGFLYGVTLMSDVVLDDLMTKSDNVTIGADQQAAYATASSDGLRALLLTYNTNIGDELRLTSLAADVNSPGTPNGLAVLAEYPAAAGISNCGSHCNAVAYIPSSIAPFNLTVRMYSDVPDNPRTYDVKCGASTNDLVASPAYSAVTQRLGVLWGNATTGELYSCTVPP
jgi:hypothetical protein